MGQKKIFIKPINDHTEKANTYRKRKLGLLKKAYELAILCGIEIKVMISDIDQYVHYFSSTEEANSKVQNEQSVYKKIIENKVIVYDNLQDAFENNPDPKKTPFIFRESTKKMRNQAQITNLRKREISDLSRFDNVKDLDNVYIYNMISKNYNTDNQVKDYEPNSIIKNGCSNKAGYAQEGHTKKKRLINLEPIPLLLEKSHLDEQLIKINNPEIRNYYSSLDKLAEVQSQTNDIRGIISCHTFKYLVDCYLNLEKNKIGTPEFKLCERLKEYPEDLLIDHIKSIDRVYNRTDLILEKSQEYNQKLVEYCIIQKNSKENHFSNFLEHSQRVLVARQDELMNENLRPYLEDFVKETFNDFIDSKTPKHLEYNNMKIDSFVDDLKKKSTQATMQNSFMESQSKIVKDPSTNIYQPEQKSECKNSSEFYINQGICIPYTNKKQYDPKFEQINWLKDINSDEPYKQTEKFTHPNSNKNQNIANERNLDVYNAVSKNESLLNEIIEQCVKTSNENRINNFMLKQV